MGRANAVIEHFDIHRYTIYFFSSVRVCVRPIYVDAGRGKGAEAVFGGIHAVLFVFNKHHVMYLSKCFQAFCWTSMRALSCKLCKQQCRTSIEREWEREIEIEQIVFNKFYCSIYYMLRICYCLFLKGVGGFSGML